MMWKPSVNAICARAHGTGSTAPAASRSPNVALMAVEPSVARHHTGPFAMPFEVLRPHPGVHHPWLTTSGQRSSASCGTTSTSPSAGSAAPRLLAASLSVGDTAQSVTWRPKASCQGSETSTLNGIASALVGTPRQRTVARIRRSAFRPAIGETLRTLKWWLDSPGAARNSPGTAPGGRLPGTPPDDIANVSDLRKPDSADAPGCSVSGCTARPELPRPQHRKHQPGQGGRCRRPARLPSVGRSGLHRDSSPAPWCSRVPQGPVARSSAAGEARRPRCPNAGRAGATATGPGFHRGQPLQ